MEPRSQKEAAKTGTLMLDGGAGISLKGGGTFGEGFRGEGEVVIRQYRSQGGIFGGRRTQGVERRYALQVEGQKGGRSV